MIRYFHLILRGNIQVNQSNLAEQLEGQSWKHICNWNYGSIRSLKSLACDKNNDLKGCQVYFSKSLEGRSKFIYENKIYYGFLSYVSKNDNTKI